MSNFHDEEFKKIRKFLVYIFIPLISVMIFFNFVLPLLVNVSDVTHIEVLGYERGAVVCGSTAIIFWSIDKEKIHKKILVRDEDKHKYNIIVDRIIKLFFVNELSQDLDLFIKNDRDLDKTKEYIETFFKRRFKEMCAEMGIKIRYIFFFIQIKPIEVEDPNVRKIPI